MINKKNLVRLVVVCVLILTGIFYFRFKPTSYPESFIKVKVKKGDFKSLVYSTGQLQAEKSVSINVPSELSARSIGIYEIKITKLIEEGTVVDSGDFVGALDHSAVEEIMSDALTNLTEELEAYEDAKIDTNINLSNLRDELVTAHIDLEEKELILKQSVYESPAVIRQANLDVEKAQRKLEQDIRNYELKKQQDIFKVKRAYNDVERVKRRISDIEGLFEAIDIRAPGPGMLIYSFDRSGNKIKVGSVVSRWEPEIAELPDLSSMISKTFINEVDISKVKKGQEVKVGVDAFPEKEFEGEVTEVANIGQVLPGGDAKVFEVSIKVYGSDPDLRPAMTTANAIVTSELEEVLYVPLEAVFHNDSLSYVFKARKPDEKQIVETGAENESFVVIKQGVKEGEELLMNSPSQPDGEAVYVGLEIYESILEKDSLQKQEKETAHNRRSQKSLQSNLEL